MFVNGACPPNVIQLKITDNPGTHPAGLAGERNKARLDLQVNLAGWAEETGAIISTEEV
jgi:hypothetical protein